MAAPLGRNTLCAVECTELVQGSVIARVTSFRLAGLSAHFRLLSWGDTRKLTDREGFVISHAVPRGNRRTMILVIAIRHARYKA